MIKFFCYAVAELKKNFTSSALMNYSYMRTKSFKRRSMKRHLIRAEFSIAKFRILVALKFFPLFDSNKISFYSRSVMRIIQ